MDLTTILTEVDGLKSIVQGEMGQKIILVVLAIAAVGLIMKLLRKAS